MELGIQANGFGNETSMYDMLNVPLQLLQYPLFNSITSKLTKNEGAGFRAVHISGGANRILVESKVENKTVAGYTLPLCSIAFLTKTADAFLTTGKPVNSISASGILL